MKSLPYYFASLLAIMVSFYPLFYLFVDSNVGLLSSKSIDITSDTVWKAVFSAHIYFGGAALLTGWSQFSIRLRTKYTILHRWLGKTYLSCVLVSGLAGLYLSFYATGGFVSSLGFGSLAVLWLVFSAQGYRAARHRDFQRHRQWMLRSFALTFAAVTLRLWLPLFLVVLSVDFFVAYPIIAWLCWVPNAIFAEWYVRR